MKGMVNMKRIFALLFLVVLLIPTGVLAQEEQPIVISGDGGELNRDAIKEAAQPLLARGATVVVYFVKEGGVADFYLRLDEEGITREGGTFVEDPNLVAIYVSTNPSNPTTRYSEILVGDNWADELPSYKLENIRQNALNVGLRAGDFSQAFASTLREIEKGIANPNAGFVPYTPSFETESSEGLPPGLVTCGIVIFIGVMLYLQMAFPEYFQNTDSEGSYRPRHSYNSSWRSSSRSNSRSSSRSSSSSGRGSRSGGSW